MSVVEQLSPSQRARALHHRLMNPANAVPDTPIDLKRPAPIEHLHAMRDPLAEYGPRDPLDLIFGPRVFWGVPKRITIERIQHAVMDYYNVPMIDFMSARRPAYLVRPRHVAMYLAKTLTTRSYPEIGRRFGDRDHTTVMNAVKQMETKRVRDPVLDKDIKTLTAQLLG